MCALVLICGRTPTEIKYFRMQTIYWLRNFMVKLSVVMEDSPDMEMCVFISNSGRMPTVIKYLRLCKPCNGDVIS